MRADRLLTILLLLQAHGRMTARALAERLEVSERTICRDMEALSGSGVPVYALRGVGGGWSLVDGYQTRLTGLKRPEIEALFLGGPAPLLADLGLADALGAALTKLLAALPSLSRQDAEFIRQRVHMDGDGWYAVEERVPYLAVLQQALWQDRRVVMGYGAAESPERVVDPLGLVAKGRIWYLLAAVEGEVRTYRVSRIQRAQVLDAPCVRPADFDLPGYWQASVARFRAGLPRYPATVRVTERGLEILRGLRFTRVGEVGAIEPDGWRRAEVQFETEEDAALAVLGVGTQLVVLEPTALRERVMAMAQEVLALYDRRDS